MPLVRLFFGTLHAMPLLAAITLALGAPGLIALGRVQPGAAGPVVVIAPPWGSALALASRADGRLLAPGRIDAIALAWSDDPGFAETLYARGAWLVLNGDLAGLLCTTGETR